ncbi:DUF2339 domain-containing protein [Mycolicibacterium mengxianglii]|uniref:hypothetical protein n=1 Tax=Mycolicibacterium mengxianglii TaxID=2736649 RepID=UPI0018EEDE7E|nr:hypothetical protein [Mycolicibacterium mengxianglii]
MATESPAYGASSPQVGTRDDDLDQLPDFATSARPGLNPELWARIWFVLAVGALAYFVQLNEVGRSAFGGSQSAYLVVAPILAGLVAAGYSRAPRGVIDAESDWIGAVLLCVGGFAAIWLIEDRLPTMAALWHVDNLGLLVWVAACGMVVFSARHVLRMWNVWLLGLLLAPVMPFLLMTAQLGGSDTANVTVSALVGTVAVYLAARFVGVRRRLLATAVNLALAAATVFVLAEAGLYLRVIVAAGAVPLVVVLALHRMHYLSRTDWELSAGATLPRCKPQSYALLLVAAIALLCVHLPMTRPATVDEARPDWIQAGALDPVEEFPFITRFLGPDATLTRYRAPGGAGEYRTVVDVMSSPDLARLQDFSDAVWYPSPTPVNYTPYEALADRPAGIKTAHSDADSATAQDTTNWSAVTWVWHSGRSYQQVTVITSQTRGLPAPSPRPLNVMNSLIEPALWVARQQPSQYSAVDPIVAASGEVVVQRLVNAAGGPSRGGLAP